MALFDSFTQTVADFRKLTPAELKRLAGARMSDLVLQEVARAKVRVAALEKRYPRPARASWRSGSSTRRRAWPAWWAASAGCSG